jgi:hypothetical protein
MKSWKSMQGLFFKNCRKKCFLQQIFHSDARSGSVVDDRIRPALESGSAVGSTKPVLLVIDEIDGATGAGENVSFRFSFSSRIS